jgi:hypothetical protein
MNAQKALPKRPPFRNPFHRRMLFRAGFARLLEESDVRIAPPFPINFAEIAKGAWKVNSIKHFVKAHVNFPQHAHESIASSG